MIKQNATDQEILEYLTDVEYAPWKFTHINNPSEAIQKAAISKNFEVFRLINNPSLAVQLHAIEIDRQ